MVCNEKESFETGFLMEAFYLNRVYWLLTRRYPYGLIFAEMLGRVAVYWHKKIFCSLASCTVNVY